MQTSSGRHVTMRHFVAGLTFMMLTASTAGAQTRQIPTRRAAAVFSGAVSVMIPASRQYSDPARVLLPANCRTPIISTQSNRATALCVTASGEPGHCMSDPASSYALIHAYPSNINRLGFEVTAFANSQVYDATLVNVGYIVTCAEL